VNATSVEHIVHCISRAFDKDALDNEMVEGTDMAIINQLNMNLLY
jgi:hypothetical protein